MRECHGISLESIKKAARNEALDACGKEQEIDRNTDGFALDGRTWRRDLKSLMHCGY